MQEEMTRKRKSSSYLNLSQNLENLSKEKPMVKEEASKPPEKVEGANSSENNANPINLSKVLPSTATLNNIQISPKSPDEEFLHFAQIQALRDEEIGKVRQQLQQVRKLRKNLLAIDDGCSP